MYLTKIIITITIIVILILIISYKHIKLESFDSQMALDIDDSGNVCSELCDGGIRNRKVTCQTSDGNIVLDSWCLNNSGKPKESETCNTQVCGEWRYGPWSECDKKCIIDGVSGIRKRIINCPTNDCVGDIPTDTSETCNNFVCGSYNIGDWGSCSVPCGPGTQTRTVTCEGGPCIEEEPSSQQSCNTEECGIWEDSPWTGCSNVCKADGADTPTRTRAAPTCSKGEGMCPQSYDKPLVEDCNDIVCGSWSDNDWGECSEICGGGNQERIVDCRDSNGNVLDNNMCTHILPKPLSFRDCNTNIVCSDWDLGSWGECSKPCNTGSRKRNKPTCAEGNICREEDKPTIETEKCNTDLCVWETGIWGF